MPRYVDITEVKRVWKEQAPLTYELIKDDLDKFPAADVRESVHGEWKDIFDDEGKWEKTVCSVCGKGCGEALPVWNFCPNCGADMQGECSYDVEPVMAKTDTKKGE